MAERPAPSPLFDFDGSRPALIEPSEQFAERDLPTACVITFLGDAVQRLIASGRARVVSENVWEDGPHPLLEMEHDGQRVAILAVGVGAPLASALFEETIAMGCRVFVACGGAGVLRKDLTLGHLIVVESAVRDEGTSHHYLPSGRYIETDRRSRILLQSYLAYEGIPFVAGRVWTTDAIYRETAAKIQQRRQEGCIAVDMEASALTAVARFRDVPLAYLLYGGDDLSGENWDHRGWQSQEEIRDGIVLTAASAALRLASAVDPAM